MKMVVGQVASNKSAHGKGIQKQYIAYPEYKGLIFL